MRGKSKQQQQQVQWSVDYNNGERLRAPYKKPTPRKNHSYPLQKSKSKSKGEKKAYDQDVAADYKPYLGSPYAATGSSSRVKLGFDKVRVDEYVADDRYESDLEAAIRNSLIDSQRQVEEKPLRILDQQKPLFDWPQIKPPIVEEQTLKIDHSLLLVDSEQEDQEEDQECKEVGIEEALIASDVDTDGEGSGWSWVSCSSEDEDEDEEDGRDLEEEYEFVKRDKGWSVSVC